MPLRTAIVHDWLIHMRGGERVLEALYEIFPDADIFTLFCDRKKLSPVLQKANIRCSFLHFLPGIKQYYRWLLPILPAAIRTLQLENYDLVISSSHCVAKGCRVPAGALHVSYCHTPARYVWGFKEEYFGHYPAPVKKLIHGVLERLKRWDLETNPGIQFFIANSENTARRIDQYYGRDSAVIHPPVDTVRLGQAEEMTGQGFLILSALVPYKRVDIAVQAFNRLGLPLTVAGTGPEMKKLKTIAGPSIRFLGALSDDEIKAQYHRCRALIFPGEEDFGIVPVEAQACGKPVIAYARGGALETVTSATGVFFSEQTPEALVQAVKRFEQLSFHAALIKENAARFDREVFKKRIRELLQALQETWMRRKAAPLDGLDNPSSLTRK